MSLLRRVARGGIAGAVGAKIGQAVASQIAPPQQQQMPPMQQPQQVPVQQQPQQPPAPKQPGVLENALAGLVGSAERFVDNAGKLISSACPKCQTVGVGGSDCEKCGTKLPDAPAIAASQDRPTNCSNCGAVAKEAVCEYCDTRLW